MQKRSHPTRTCGPPAPLPSTYVPLAPDDHALPVRWGHAHQGDAPITALHRHEVLELGYCYEGTGVFLVEGKVMPFTAGCATVINQHESHLARSTPGTSSRWMWILFSPRLLIADPAADPAVLDAAPLRGPRFANVLEPDRQPALCALVRALADELAGSDAARPDAVRGLAWALMARLQRLPRGPRERAVAGRSRALERVTAALNLIARDYSRSLDLPRLASACGVSAPSLRRQFQRALGHSPKRYLLRYRVQQAAAALRADRARAITDIAFSCGFESLSAFNRHFRAVLGVAPREWRGRA